MYKKKSSNPTFFLRKLYWTNTNWDKPTIERSNLDGSEREVLISGNVDMPQDISIDQANDKIYWADVGSGIYYRIESANLDGTNRKIVLEDTHQRPYSIAVTDEMIYWTDLTSEALWGIKKGADGEKPVKYRSFNEEPMGIFAKNDISTVEHCKGVVQVIEKNKKTVELFEIATDSIQCLNYGELVNSKCHCVRGFTGTRCETNLCHNYCIHGTCSISTEGYPQCKCLEGFAGSRCESEMCNGYCLNDGICKLQNNEVVKTCECRQGFSGERCEIKSEIETLCTVLCEEGEEFNVIESSGKKCR